MDISKAEFRIENEQQASFVGLSFDDVERDLEIPPFKRSGPVIHCPSVPFFFSFLWFITTVFFILNIIVI